MLNTLSTCYLKQVFKYKENVKHKSIRVNVVSIYILPLKKKEMKGNEICMYSDNPFKRKEKKKRQRIFKI